VLVLRIWLEGTDADARVRIRLTGRGDVTRAVETSKVVGSVGDAASQVRAWLDDYVSSRVR
jgi:hypothetical protein